MLDIAIVGIGNAGNQIAALATERLSVASLAINSSEKDLETVKANVLKRTISNTDGSGKGAGKDRAKAKAFLKDSIMKVMDGEVQNLLKNRDVIFVISSTGGGTGSGAAPIFSELLGSMFPDTIVITIGILPVNGEALSAHVNTLQYLDEIFTSVTNLKYMLYDNDRLASLPTYKMMLSVNEEVVKDIDVIRCTYNYATQYDSIDEADMKRLIGYTGRIIVARLDEVKDRTVDSSSLPKLLLDKIKNNCHAELNRDKKVIATGLIANLSEALSEDFDNHIPEICDYIGSADHDFTHTSINAERKITNRMFFIASGLSRPSDKIGIIQDRIDEITASQKIKEDEDAMGTVDIKSLVDQIASKDTKRPDTKATEVSMASLFSKFGA